jgi:hypothetical protein
VCRLIEEAQRSAEALAKNRLLPKAFDLNIYALTLNGLTK